MLDFKLGSRKKHLQVVGGSRYSGASFQGFGLCCFVHMAPLWSLMKGVAAAIAPRGKNTKNPGRAAPSEGNQPSYTFTLVGENLVQMMTLEFDFARKKV